MDYQNENDMEQPSSPLVQILRNANFSHWIESLGDKPVRPAMQHAIRHLSNPQLYPKVNLGPRVELPSSSDKNATSQLSSQKATTSSDLPCYSGGIRLPSQDDLKRLKIPKKSSSSSVAPSVPGSNLSKIGSEFRSEVFDDKPLPASRADSIDRSSTKYKKDKLAKKKDKDRRKDSSTSKSRRESKSKDKSSSKSQLQSNKSQFSKSSNESPSIVESGVATIVSTSSDTIEAPVSTSCELESLEKRLARVVGQVSPSQLIPEKLTDRPAHLSALERRYSGDSTDSKGKKRKRESQNKEKKEKKKKDAHTSELRSEDRILLRISRDAIREFSPVVTAPPSEDADAVLGQQPEGESTLRSGVNLPEVILPEVVLPEVILPEVNLAERLEGAGTPGIVLVDGEDEVSCLSGTTDGNMDLDDDVATEPNSEAEEADIDGMTTPVFTNADFREVEVKKEKVAPTFVEMATQTEVDEVVQITTISLPNTDQLNHLLEQVEPSVKKLDAECQTEERSHGKNGEVEDEEDELLALEGDLLMTRLREMEQKAHEHIVGVAKDGVERERLLTDTKSGKELLEAAKKRLEKFESERNTVLGKEKECEESVTEGKKKVEDIKQETVAWKRKEIELKIATTNAKLAVLYFERDRENHENDPEYLGLVSKKNGLKEEYDNYFSRLKELEEQLTVQEGALAVAEDSYNGHRAERERVDTELADLEAKFKSSQEDYDKLQVEIQKLSQAITSKQREALDLKYRVLKVQCRLRDTSPPGTVFVLLEPPLTLPLDEKEQGVGVVAVIRTPTASPDSSLGGSQAQTPSESPDGITAPLVHEFFHALIAVHISLYSEPNVTVTVDNWREICRMLTSVAIKLSHAYPEYSTATGYAKIADLFRGMICTNPTLCLQCRRNVAGLPTYERVTQIFNVSRKMPENENQSSPRAVLAQTPSVVPRGEEPKETQGDQPANDRLPTIRVKPLSRLYGTVPLPLTPQEASNTLQANEQAANVPNANGTPPNVPMNQQRMVAPPVIQQVRIPPSSFSPNAVPAASQNIEQRPQQRYPVTMYSTQLGQQNVGHNSVVYGQIMNGQATSSYGSTVPMQTGPRVTSADMRTPMVNNGIQYGNQRPLVGTQVFCILCNKPADRYCPRCNAVPYCSNLCQANGWSRHVTYCKGTMNYGGTNRMHGS